MPTNLENSAVATGPEKQSSFQSQRKEVNSEENVTKRRYFMTERRQFKRET